MNTDDDNTELYKGTDELSVFDLDWSGLADAWFA